MVHAHDTEVIASRSELLSLHCPRHPLLRALLPACADPQVFTRQDCPAYAGEPLHTVGLLEAAHQYSLQDMCGSTRTPIPTSLSTQEWQFKNLTPLIHHSPPGRLSSVGAAVQTASPKAATQQLPHNSVHKEKRDFKKNISMDPQMLRSDFVNHLQATEML